MKIADEVITSRVDYAIKFLEELIYITERKSTRGLPIIFSNVKASHINIELEVKNNKWTRIEKNTCIGPES
ncbi:uncharacterized protein OCT59_009037 [Rhizophagus irregularis]|uniref:Uncharacterized protein n=3 Tax=Rhizophagus irregularis TaxID=588596 RepID=A0A916EGQ2_9GLOM|nr:hypothetical protein RirG_015300 [Rhizophagus irregularis DAOM 197198w]UZO17695.1 hypothetical protein OCT59_009037 [Rhizophagus irregularis]GBC24369.2 hypothetical protein RIR_jg741.t1 [Rhizophagus irregularis DAOM 181602=DAOM 197198]CAB4475028.1 unnamed protein product [Rhizophagus irregularis]CAB5386825.1 unnamed protein product [Rhizophagus irregularis]